MRLRADSVQYDRVKVPSRSFWWGVISVVVIVGIACSALLASAVRSGLSARDQPSAIETVAARSIRRLAVPRRSRELPNPIAFSPQVFADARAHFADHCATCHANDGSGDTTIGRNLYPKAPDMRLEDTQRMTDGELYFIIQNGIRLSGMPAWGKEGDENDQDGWKLVHFIRHLKDLTPEQLKEMKSMNPKTPEEIEEERQEQELLRGGAEPKPEPKKRPMPSHKHGR